MAYLDLQTDRRVRTIPRQRLAPAM